MIIDDCLIFHNAIVNLCPLLAFVAFEHYDNNASRPSNTMRLLLPWINIITNPPSGQEEQRNQRPSPDLGIMMRPRPRTRPPSSLPPLHALQFRTLINLYYTIDLSIRMHMILAPELGLRGHVHRRDAEETCFWAWSGDFGTPIIGS